jgi:PRC-barrel domain
MSDIPSWIGTKLGDHEGVRVGVVCDVFFDDANSRPAWLLVNLLRMGERYAVVPAQGARSWRGMVTVPYERDHIRASPTVAPGATLCGDLLASLARHYGVRVDRHAGFAAVHGAARAAAA